MTFSNPIITSHDVPDPWVVRHDGWYYLTGTLAPSEGLVVWKSRRLVDWSEAVKDTVWTAPDDGPMSRQIWAPELYRFEGRWYLYFTASDGHDQNHRHYVLESMGDDPMGTYRNRGRMDKELDEYAIDGSVLEANDGSLYWMYTADQRLGIAPMTNPWTVDGSKRAVLARPTEPWERGWIEAPEALVHDGRVFVIYSAGHSATPHYVMGRLTHEGGEILDPEAWTKKRTPVFTPYVGAKGAVYTTGHCTFTTSPDGTETWMVYHGKSWRDPSKGGFEGRRARAQRVDWSPQGTPEFGRPVPAGVPLSVPARSPEE
jgi:GH43 family beta-xylosidase